MSRDPVKLEFDDVTIESRPLPYTKAEDILPDVLKIVAIVVRSIAGTKLVEVIKGFKRGESNREQIVRLLPQLAPTLEILADQLGDGRLKRLAPLVLGSTTVVGPFGEDGGTERKELHSVKDRATVFDACPHLYLISLFHAGRVTFGPFFSVKDLLAGRKAEAA